MTSQVARVTSVRGGDVVMTCNGWRIDQGTGRRACSSDKGTGSSGRETASAVGAEDDSARGNGRMRSVRDIGLARGHIIGMKRCR